MLTPLLTRLVRFAAGHAWAVIVAALLCSAAGAVYVARHFAIDTDIDRLLDTNAPWAQRDGAISKVEVMSRFVGSVGSGHWCSLGAARLPSERELFAPWGGPAARFEQPPRSLRSLPPAGELFAPWGGPAALMA